MLKTLRLLSWDFGQLRVLQELIIKLLFVEQGLTWREPGV